ISANELPMHSSKDDCWIAVDGRVYDCTSYLATRRHPGGGQIILDHAGGGASDDFSAVH
ncbi:cytochrome b5-like heme/steroid binding domain-containing protein, partial [Pelagophyceae sp. CCMP2097]